MDNSMNFTIRNVALERVVDRFTSKAKSAVEVKCTYCAPPPEAATKTCVDCSVSCNVESNIFYKQYFLSTKRLTFLDWYAQCFKLFDLVLFSKYHTHLSLKKFWCCQVFNKLKKNMHI